MTPNEQALAAQNPDKNKVGVKQRRKKNKVAKASRKRNRG